MDALAMPWVNAMVAHLLAIRRMAPVKVGNDHDEGYITSQDGFVMYTQKVETLEPFSSHVIPVKMTEAYLGERLNVMGAGPVCTRWHLATWLNHAEYVY